MAHVTNVMINNQTVEIEVDGSGRFTAEFDDQDFTAKTMEELGEQLRVAGKKSRETKAVDVSVIDHVLSKDRYDPLQSGIGVVHAKLRGQHERNHEWLLTAESGQKFKVRQWGSGERVICRRMTESEVAEYMQLANAVKTAEKVFESFRAKMRADPKRLLKVKE